MTVRFLPVSPVAPARLPPIARAVADAIPWVVLEIGDYGPDATASVDRERRQARSGDLLAALAFFSRRPGERVIGLTEADLFVPVFTFVFGEGRLDGVSAIVSVHRLRPEVYGLPPDEDLTHRRAATEVVHELGHTFGLRHCLEPFCAMRTSRAADEIDGKGPGYCPACEAFARKAAGVPAWTHPIVERPRYSAERSHVRATRPISAPLRQAQCRLRDGRE